MQYITKLKLAAVQQLCDTEDKSTEYMLQLMQDVCKVSLDTVLNYLEHEDKPKLYKDLNSLTEVIVQLENRP